jgi:hypothetical protein
MKNRPLALLVSLLLPFAVIAGEGHDHGKAPAAGHGADAAAKEVTLRGEVLDMACWVAHEGKGPKHAACAQKCLKDGQPMGLLTQDGTVYLLFGDHADTTAYSQARGLGAKNVEIRGEIADRAGIHGLTVKSVKAL